MTYQYGGEIARAKDEEAHARAKFAYFRKAESGINAGVERSLVEYNPAPIRKRSRVAECGTHSGWARHGREGTAPCRECLDARADYQRYYRARRKHAA